MSEVIDKPTGLDSEFVKTLVRVLRAEDTYGVWENKPDGIIIADFIVTKEQRRLIPIIGDPDPDVLSRVEKFYVAIGLDVERLTGHIASPMMKMSHEGFGRVLLTVGRLVVLSRSLRDVHRFGFVDHAALAEAGEKAVAEAKSWIDKLPEVANA